MSFFFGIPNRTGISILKFIDDTMGTLLLNSNVESQSNCSYKKKVSKIETWQKFCFETKIKFKGLLAIQLMAWMSRRKKMTKNWSWFHWKIYSLVKWRCVLFFLSLHRRPEVRHNEFREYLICTKKKLNSIISPIQLAAIVVGISFIINFHVFRFFISFRVVAINDFGSMEKIKSNGTHSSLLPLTFC